VRVTRLKVPERLGRGGERTATVDRGSDGTCLDQVGKNLANLLDSALS
jgi:hypothetical protein